MPSDPPPRIAADTAQAAGLARAAAAIARLDEAVAYHPLRPAFLYRARLDAVRLQAAVDGFSIDPWHLAAVLEGLRLRMNSSLRIIDRGMIFAAARHAFDQHQWLVAPDFDQEGAVRQAAAHLARFAAQGDTPLLAAARGLHAWLGGDHGGGDGHPGSGPPESAGHGRLRPPIRAALVRFWMRHRVLRAPVPLTGAASLRAETPCAETTWELSAWLPAFLVALAEEAEDGRQLLTDLERAWFTARAAVAGRRRDSHAAAAVDVLAAVPLVSATSLAAGLGLAVKTAIRLLDDLAAAGLAVEVSHRAKRRLFGLKGMAPLRDEVAPPRRPEPGRGPGRPPILPVDDGMPEPVPLPPLTPMERRAFDYSELAHWMANADLTIRNARWVLDTIVRQPIPADLSGQGESPGN